ncbi:LexA/Signal peptidase [Xylona heveae TC161]|uniref:LexA/Signal peptidase n=1 Tax=Xylona heveae (strain CBS 132557 / TC161) TaxID=1328760 RepID=A0A165JUP3_XYLHT|nr:LexA/Signal peptidase [Xylona heveae TC161]KZF26654.1 LexA/Signal peptidase [Xylona heveae TC161]
MGSNLGSLFARFKGSFSKNVYGSPFHLALQTAKVLCFGHIINEHVITLAPTIGPSMLPTIEAKGDWVLISRLNRRGRGISVGDVVSADHPAVPGRGAIKRVIGLPGDFVERKTPGSDNPTIIQIPEGHCWIVGDNLPHSRDSRMYGPLPLALIKGKVLGVLFPWNERRRIRNNVTALEL